jgi:hypothetical protein
MARKSKPWAVIVSTPGGQVRTEHTGEKKAYETVRDLRAAIDASESHVIAIRVEQWESDANRWVWFDQPYPEES